MWTIGLLFWGLTFIPVPSMHVIFSYIATGIMWANMIRLGGIVLLKCISFMADSYKNEYKYYGYKIEWGGDTAIKSIDFSLELSTFIGQMIAYPLLQHSIKNLQAYSNGELKMKKADNNLPNKNNGNDTIFATESF